jgi:hypothetical protein
MKRLAFFILVTSCATHHPPTRSSVAAVPIVAEPAPEIYEPRVVGADARVVSGTGYSLVVPSMWKRIPAEGVDLAFASYDGDDAGMSISAQTLDAQKPMNELVEGVTKGVMSNGRATVTRHETIRVGGRDVLVNEFAMAGRGPMLQGIIRAQTSDDGIISVVCHSVASAWDELKSGCAPIFATIRVGAAAKAATPAPARMRWLEGAGFRVAIPEAWIDGAGHRATTLALARSSDDLQSMLAITVIGEEGDAQPTEKNRDAILSRWADDETHRHDQTARVTSTARNVVNLEFLREADAPHGVMLNAFYDFGTTKLFVGCGGLDPAYSKHADICRVAFRSVRPEPPR